MNLASLLQAPGQLTSSRFFRVAYFPTCAGVVYLLVLIWAGAPAHRVNFSRAWGTVSHLGVGGIVLLVIGVTLVAVVVQPFQLWIVRLLEGAFPGANKLRGFQESCRNSLRDKRDKAINEAVAKPDTPEGRLKRDALIQKAGTASERLRSRYPLPDYLVRSTALGNALAAMEDTAGAAYGLDPVVTWPRLYPLLGEQARAAVDDFRDSMDAAARLAATGVVAAAATVALLAWHSGWWSLLALVPLAIAMASYRGTIPAAIGYGLAMQVAFDLHRFDLLQALHLAAPSGQGGDTGEQTSNQRLSDFLRQGVPVPFTYVHTADPNGNAANG